jgi:hypothetical protein
MVSLRKAKNSEFWRYTNGRILSATIEQSERNSGSQGKEIRYTPKISYTYSVNDQEHISGRIKFMSDYSSASLEAVREIIKKYRPGSEVIVHYNPVKPKRAVLEKCVSKDIYILLAFSVIILLGTLILANHLGYIHIV